MALEMKVNEEYEVVILKQDHFGRGIAKIENIFVFVDNALPGEVCLIEIKKIKKHFLEANIKKILKPSSFRILPKCPYYGNCGGCHLMHQEYQKQLIFKENKVKELLQKFTGLEDVLVFPIVGKNCFGYRNKVIFHGSDRKLGFYRENTNQLVPIETCLITNINLNQVYHKIQKFLLEHKETQITDVMLRCTSLNEYLVVLNGNHISVEDLLPYLKEVSTIYVNHQLIKGKPYIEEKIDNIIFKIYPNSFFQINYDIMLELYHTIMHYYQNKNYDKVLDLYCGTGTIGMLVSNYVKQVIGVEKEFSSIESANQCKKINHISNISFIEGKVEDNIDSFKEVDSIIIDPPRSGLDYHTLDMILELSPQSITYISCDPATLARDLKELLKDYQILEIHPFDMFPNTFHVENIVFLERKEKK